MISYQKLLALCKERGVNSYTMKKHKIMGQAAWASIRAGGDVRLSTIDALCRFLNCQPGDLLEYIPDEAAPATDLSPKE